LFDYLLVQKFGASGLVLATVAVNVISMIVMMYVLDRRLNGMPLKSWSITILGLVIASVIAGGISWGLYYVMSQNFANMSVIMRFGAEVSGLLIASAVGLIIFGALALQMKIPEINTLTNQIKRRFSRK
ncbi:MAG: polysaccharide biosynthesis C-terminal domain-containing protein, partial [Pseudanabaena sp.]